MNTIARKQARVGGLGGGWGEEAQLASERGERRELNPNLLCGTYTDLKINVADKNEHNSP